MRAAAARPFEVDVRPPWPYRLPRFGAGDGVMTIRDGVVDRLLHVQGAPVRIRVWLLRDGIVRFRAEPVDPGAVRYKTAAPEAREATPADLGLAVERMRFALAVDDDLAELYARFRTDPMLGSAIRRCPWARPRRRPWPWEALCLAIVNQLIEASRAAAIQRRIIGRWAPSHQLPPIQPDDLASGSQRPRGSRGSLRDLPSPKAIAGRAPAELVAMDLAEGRAVAMIRCAREIAAGRADPSDPAGDRRLLAIREIGPWTIQCLGLAGRGDPDSLPAGDLAYIKLVGHLADLRRRATVEEVEEYFRPYAPYRGLAGTFALAAYGKALTRGTQFPFDAGAAMRRDLAA